MRTASRKQKMPARRDAGLSIDPTCSLPCQGEDVRNAVGEDMHYTFSKGNLIAKNKPRLHQRYVYAFQSSRQKISQPPIRKLELSV
jgi:hypothetical protein